MTARFIHDGNNIDYTPASDVAAGEVVVQSELVGIAKLDIASGALGALAVSGVFDVSREADTAFSAGDRVFWDADGDPEGGTAGSGAAVSSDGDGSNQFLGHAVEAVTDDAANTTVRVLMRNDAAVAATSASPLANTITDPGDAGAIPVTASGSVPLFSNSAETRTLADPTFIGQMISLGFKANGGDVVVTTASPVNQNGDNTLTFDTVGDVIVLVAIEVGVDIDDIEWRVMANDGVTLATV